tara:strand:+ start:1043 stop:1435 length:393 start_codon:yes stop_codon:yes gene_type:complete
MKKVLLILCVLPLIGFGQCIDGDCENGIGIYIWEDGNSITNGSWKDGKQNGIVQQIEYDEEGRLVGSFDGEMKMGVISGWGTETIYDKEGYLLGTYVGNWENDDYNGWGIWIWRDGTIEKGTYKEGELIR